MTEHSAPGHFPSDSATAQPSSTSALDAALRASEQRVDETNQIMTAVLGHTDMMTVLLDPRFNFIWVNRAYADTCKQPPSFFPGRNHFALYPNPENQAIFQRVVETGQPYFVSAKPFSFPDQPERGITYWDWSLIPVTDSAGTVTRLVFTLADVTQRVRIEQEVHQREVRHRAILRAAMDGFCLVDTDGRLLEVNDTYCRMSGYSEAELLNMRVSDLEATETPTAVKARLQQLIVDGEARYESQHRRKDGGVFHVEVSAQCHDTEAGMLVVFLHDITARKHTERALRLKNLVFDASTAANSIAGIDGRLTEVNDAFLRMWGYRSRDEVLGKPIPHLLASADEAAAILNALNQTGQWEGDCTARRGDGSTFDAHSLATVVRDEHGRIIGYQSAVADLTARQQAEAALRRSEALLASSQAMAHVGSWELELPTRQLTWSDEVYRIFGLRPNEISPSYDFFLQAVHPEDRPMVDAAYAQSLQNDQPGYQVEHRIVRHGTGEVRFVQERCMHVRDAEGQLVRSVGMVQDVTDLKRAEEHREALENQNRQLQKTESLGRMAAAIAHHFNNQLCGIVGHLSLALQDLPRVHPARESIDFALQGANQAADVSRLMLTYLGQSVVASEALDLSEMCRRTLPALQAALPGHVSLTTDLPSPGPVVLAHSGEISQILTNLVSNAWEACAQAAGRIRLSVRTTCPDELPKTHHFPVDWQPQPVSYAALEVADNGCGIAAADLEKLFDPFYSTKFTGRGMGLPVVLGIVRARGGAIAVDSGTARGSTFRVLLPVTSRRPAASPPVSSPSSAMSGEGTILLVDDAPILRNATARILERLGFDVLLAEDGAAALEVFRHHHARVRLVICDLTMPRMDGWQTLAALRQIEPTIPVVLCSGYSEASVMAGDHTEHPQAFLGKPYSVDELRDTIIRVLASHPRSVS